MDSTLSQMSEAWEDILLEMDSKLLKFAEEKYVSSFISCSTSATYSAISFDLLNIEFMSRVSVHAQSG